MKLSFENTSISTEIIEHIGSQIEKIENAVFSIEETQQYHDNECKINKDYLLPESVLVIGYRDTITAIFHVTKDYIYGMSNGGAFKFSNMEKTDQLFEYYYFGTEKFTEGFKGHTQLQKVCIHDRLCNKISFPDGMFQNCTSLGYVDFGRSKVDISKNCFSGCNSLVNCEIERIGKLEKNAFVNCNNYTTLKVKEIDEISAGAFSFSSIERIELLDNEQNRYQIEDYGIIEIGKEGNKLVYI